MADSNLFLEICDETAEAYGVAESVIASSFIFSLIWCLIIPKRNVQLRIF